MPQLSPMMGLLIFIAVLFSYTILLASLSKKAPLIRSTKMSKSFKKSLKVFN
uniref:ATP synthase F0 subunit 8 n=1 Tax=Hypselodoris whitei TaxID=508163 RepID=UPI002A829C58|nr:ATP synthase F0 subunit 8 [Hypselodoris whitei]WOK01431.1 ATP synthase F0 subunit 8 [Hypselodoris whitei]